MKTIQQWLAEYGQSHQHPTNVLIHKICVPLIMFSLLGFLWLLPAPFLPLATNAGGNCALLSVACGLLYYWRLSPPLALGMLLIMLLPMLLALYLLGHIAEISLGYLSLIIFVLSWILQFIGHKIEGKKPSFLQDLQFLLIGPLWVISPLLRFPLPKTNLQKKS